MSRETIHLHQEAAVYWNTAVAMAAKTIMALLDPRLVLLVYGYFSFSVDDFLQTHGTECSRKRKRRIKDDIVFYDDKICLGDHAMRYLPLDNNT